MTSESTFKKWFGIFAFSCIAFGGIMVLIRSSPLYDIHGFNFADVKSIKIYDRGLYGNGVIEIKGKEKIQQIGRLINTSASISELDFNPKATKGLCEVDIISKDNKTTTITVDNNMDAGGIISSGQWSYKSDSLLSIILNELGNKKQ